MSERQGARPGWLQAQLLGPGDLITATHIDTGAPIRDGELIYDGDITDTDACVFVDAVSHEEFISGVAGVIISGVYATGDPYIRLYPAMEMLEIWRVDPAITKRWRDFADGVFNIWLRDSQVTD